MSAHVRKSRLVDEPFLIHHIVPDGRIKNIYAFGITEKAKTNFFTEEELDKYERDNTRMYFFPNFRIYGNDTVNDMKRKVIFQLASQKIDYTHHDMYFFYKSDAKYTMDTLYAGLTTGSGAQHNVSYTKMNAFFKNANAKETDGILSRVAALLNDVVSKNTKKKHVMKEERARMRMIEEMLEINSLHSYSYQDIYKLATASAKSQTKTEFTFEMNRPFGTSVNQHDTMKSHVVNPYDIKAYHDVILLGQYLNNVFTDNEQCILEFPGFDSRNVYMCTFDDCMDSEVYNNHEFIQIYFPYLHLAEVTDKSTYNNRRDMLHKNMMDTFCTKNAMRRVQTLQQIHEAEFYDYQIEQTAKANLLFDGCRNIQFNINPSVAYNIPMRELFEKLKTSPDMSVIKYVIEKKSQSMVKVSIAGYGASNKGVGLPVPQISEKKIRDIIKIYNKQNTIVTYGKVDSNIEVYTIISYNGTLWVRLNILNEAYTKLSHCQDVIRDYIQKNLIEVFKNTNIVREQIFEFDGLFSDNISELSINYNWLFKHNRDEKQIMMAFAAMSDVFVKDVGTKMSYNYKRVSNYDDMDQIESMIVTLINQKYHNPEDIASEISELYKIDLEDARKRVESKIPLLRRNAERSIYIKKSGGFKTYVSSESVKNQLGFEVQNINSIRHIHFVLTYIQFIVAGLFDEKIFKKLIKVTSVNKESKKDNEPTIVEIEDINTTIQSHVRTTRHDTRPTDDSDDIYVDDIDQYLSMSDNESQGSPSKSEEALDLDDIFDDSEEDETVEGGGDGECLLCQDGGDGVLLIGGFNGSLGVSVQQEGGFEAFRDQVMDGHIGGVKSFAISAKTMSAKTPKSAKKKNSDTDNEFLRRLQHADPKVFINEVPTNMRNQFNTYAARCPWNMRRQPVPLTDDDKKIIDKDHPGSYEETYKYRGHWYICPRYWNRKLQRPLNKEQVESGEFGNIMNSTNDGEIYDFGQNKYWDGKNLNPNFIAPEKHPDGLCMPCCQKKTTTVKWKELRDRCLSKEALPDDPTRDDGPGYILNENRSLLERGRYGFPQNSLKYLIRHICKRQSKNHKECLLRYGTDNDRTNHFLAAIAYYYENGTWTVSKFVSDVLIPAITLDIFVDAQNGNLIQTFAPFGKVNDVNVYSDESIKILDEYKQSKTYISFAKESLENLRIFYRMCVAHKEFIKQLESLANKRGDKYNSFGKIIDYKYLWDIICTPNPRLFINGLNLVILDLIEDVNTVNVRIVCPTNQFAHKFFDARRPTALLLKMTNNVYQPLVLASIQKKTPNVIQDGTTIKRTFEANHWFIESNLEPLLQRINDECRPIKSINAYMFEMNHPSTYVYEVLKNAGCEVLLQYVNHNGMTVGFKVVHNGKHRYVPTYPSNIIALPMEAFDFEEMKDMWVSLSETIEWMKALKIRTKSVLKIDPKFKVVQNSFVVGILTEANQFIPLREKESNDEDSGLPQVRGYNYADLNTRLLWQEEEDLNELTELDIDYLQRVRLESMFYRLFKDAAKNEVNSYTALKEKKEIASLLEDYGGDESYEKRVTSITDILRRLLVDKVEFSDYDADSIQNMVMNTKCNELEESECENTIFCKYRSNACIFVIPKYNLLNFRDNEAGYFLRLADELLRYDHISSVFMSRSYNLEFYGTNENRRNEVILPVTVILNGYFHQNTLENTVEQYDVVSHDLQTPYKIDGAVIDESTEDMRENVKELTKSYLISLLQPIKGYETIFVQSDMMTKTYIILNFIFRMHSSLIDERIGKTPREYLNDVVTNLQNEDVEHALRIYHYEGKHSLVKSIRQKIGSSLLPSVMSMEGTQSTSNVNKSPMEHLISDPSYYITFLDILFVMSRMNVSVIVYSSTFNRNILSLCGKCELCKNESLRVFRVMNQSSELDYIDKTIIIEVSSSYNTQINRPYQMRILHLNNTKKCIYDDNELPPLLKKECENHTYSDIFNFLEKYALTDSMNEAVGGRQKFRIV